MRYAVLPPEYFPGLVTAALIATVDAVVLADTVQYSRQSRQNRACLRTPDGTQWISVPIPGGQFGKSIRDTRIDPGSGWRRKHEKAIRFNYGSTPYYEHLADAVRDVVYTDADRLGPVTTRATEFVCHQVHPGADVGRASDLPGAPDSLEAIAALRPHDELVLLSADRTRTSLERATPIHVEEPVYRQRFSGFEPGCSALDLIMMHGPAARGVLLECVSFQGA